LSYTEVSKRKLVQLREQVRDILDVQEAIAPAAGIANAYRIFTPQRNSGMGLDLTIFNAAAVAGNATIEIDNTRIVTLAPAQRLDLSNVLFYQVRIIRLGAAILVDAYWSGVSFDLLKELPQ